jgi:hypothetical protein
MHPYVQLAKKAVETFIKEGKVISTSKDLPKVTSEIFERQAGTFVSLCICRGKEKQLCGCIGTYLPTKDNIADEIIANAIAAATQDYRFEPITEDKLEQISYTVYILNPPDQIKNLDELDPKKYGVIIKTLDGRSGLLLPDLEGIKDPEQQVMIASQKGGINPAIEEISLYRFTVEKYE